MDLDDLSPRPIQRVAVGDNLAQLSVTELEKRIQIFEDEIARVREELKRKHAHNAAAAAIFKS